jgi:hypothetical protein
MVCLEKGTTNLTASPFPEACMIMMRKEDIKIDRVLSEFQQGDADKRLCLFMYYRELRDEFTCIEENYADCFGRSRWRDRIGDIVSLLAFF